MARNPIALKTLRERYRLLSTVTISTVTKGGEVSGERDIVSCFADHLEFLGMSDKQVFVAMLGGLLSALLGGLLIVPITLLARADGGDDGWGLLWFVLMIVSGVAGLIWWAKWARSHINE